MQYLPFSIPTSLPSPRLPSHHFPSFSYLQSLLASWKRITHSGFCFSRFISFISFPYLGVLFFASHFFFLSSTSFFPTSTAFSLPRDHFQQIGTSQLPFLLSSRSPRSGFLIPSQISSLVSTFPALQSPPALRPMPVPLSLALFESSFHQPSHPLLIITA